MDDDFGTGGEIEHEKFEVKEGVAEEKKEAKIEIEEPKSKPLSAAYVIEESRVPRKSETKDGALGEIRDSSDLSLMDEPGEKETLYKNRGTSVAPGDGGIPTIDEESLEEEVANDGDGDEPGMNENEPGQEVEAGDEYDHVQYDDDKGGIDVDGPGGASQAVEKSIDVNESNKKKEEEIVPQKKEKKQEKIVPRQKEEKKEEPKKQIQAKKEEISQGHTSDKQNVKTTEKIKETNAENKAEKSGGCCVIS